MRARWLSRVVLSPSLLQHFQRIRARRNRVDDKRRARVLDRKSARKLSQLKVALRDRLRSLSAKVERLMFDQPSTADLPLATPHHGRAAKSDATESAPGKPPVLPEPFQ